MQTRHILLAILIAAVWGVNFVAAKWAVTDFSPFLANTVRFSIVAVVFLPFLKIVKGRMRILILTAFLLGVAHFGVTYWAVAISGGVGAVAIASQLSVPFSTILAVLFLGESVGWKRVAGVAVSFAGILVMGFDPVIFSYWQGLFLMAIAALLFSVSSILMRSLKDVPVTTVQAWIGLVAMIGSGVLSLIFETEQVARILSAREEAWLGIVFSALGSSVIGHGLANYLFSKYEVTVVAPYFLIVPLFAVSAGVLMLGEVVTERLAFGGFLTVLGVLVVTLRNKARHVERADAAG
ncbi:MAG: DMT family transporter [Kordiimonadaceae bacterium]|nr:DMT family transporter [Kordiimonadaceae bacterium]